MKLVHVENYDEMSMQAARAVFDKITSSERVVLGLATGSTPEKMYDYLVDMLNKNKVDLSHVYTVNLDEYVGLDADHPQSYHQYMNRIFFDRVDIPKNHTFLPNGAAENLEDEVAEYEKLIEELGGVDLQVLGIGRNGHIAFNEPGTAFDSETHVVDLTETTVNDNARFFDTIDEVPKQAISMGLSTIMNAKSIVMMASGEEKADAITAMMEGEVDESLPGSILQRHHDVTVIADRKALREG